MVFLLRLLDGKYYYQLVVHIYMELMTWHFNELLELQQILATCSTQMIGIMNKLGKVEGFIQIKYKYQ